MDGIEVIANAFKIRASATLDICAGTTGLTEAQEIELATLIQRNTDFANGVPKVKPLTDILVAKLVSQTYKRDNPELPDGAKTYCKKWLKEYLYKRRADIKSKYIEKGNSTEEDGFTLMAVELGLGMVYKNTQYHSNEYMQGTDDLFVNGVVYDNKSSWSLDTFPMFEAEIPDDKYEWQLNTYCVLRGVNDAVLAYTLIDAPIEMVERELKWLPTDNEKYRRAVNMLFTTEAFEAARIALFPDATYTYFTPIPQEKRIKKFPVTCEQYKTNLTIERVKMCRSYILTLLKS